MKAIASRQNLIQTTMKKHSIILATSITLFSSIFFSSCKEKAPIDKKKMTEMVAEYYMLDGVSKHELREDRSLDMNLIYIDFLHKYGVTAAEFDSSVSFYAKNPIELKEIYEGAIKIVNKRLDAVNKDLGQ